MRLIYPNTQIFYEGTWQGGSSKQGKITESKKGIEDIGLLGRVDVPFSLSNVSIQKAQIKEFQKLGLLLKVRLCTLGSLQYNMRVQ
jgi:hypothetical protein